MPEEITIAIPVPIGSEAENVNTGWGTKNLSPLTLNGLANYTASGSLSYDNEASASTCDVIITLSNLSMASPGYVRIDDGTNYYELEVPAGTSGKRVVFKTIPVAFLASFTIYNGTGLTLNSSGNFISVVPN